MSTQSKTINVFLGGACDPTTWRTDTAIPALEAAGVTFFNPQVPNWTAEFERDVERPAKAAAGTLLFVVDGQTRAIGSIAEIGFAVAAGRDVVVVVNDIKDGHVINGQTITGRELKDLNRGRSYIQAECQAANVPCFRTIEEAIDHLVEKYGS